MPRSREMFRGAIISPALH